MKAKKDLSRRVLLDLLDGLNPKVIAYNYDISKGSVSNWKKRFLHEILILKRRLPDPDQLELFDKE